MDYHERMKQYYDRRAPEYEDSIPGFGDKAEHPEAVEDMPGLLRAVSLLPPARVLDVACGAGFLTRHLRGEVTGLDQSEAMLEIARERDRTRFLAGARRVADELILVEPTPEWGPGGRAEGWEERVLSDGSRYEIYRRYFTAGALTEELGGRILFAGKWVVMAAG